MESIDIEDMDCDTCLIMQGILTDEIDDSEFLEFAIDNLSEMFEDIAKGNLNIRIHRNIKGPPKDALGKPARRAVWRASVCLAGEMWVWGGARINL